jgi:alpha-beta hydrolase superfamily lysophospholipase
MKTIISVASNPVNVWSIENPQAIVIIAHGMMEHADRYAVLAEEMNHSRIYVYAIHHLGHGINEEYPKGHWPKDGFSIATQRVADLVSFAKKMHPEVPVFLLGHSMGSFIAQNYMANNPQVQGVILSGTNGPSAMVKLGKFVARLVGIFRSDTQPSPFLHHLSFDGFQKPFRPNRTSCDWLSRDKEQVDLYVADPLCGFTCTVGFYNGFLTGLSVIHQPKQMAKIPTNLPVYLFSGAKDPVGNMGKGVELLTSMYKKIGLKDVSMKLYPEGRHEMFNELNRNDVYRDVIDWILNHC